MRFIESRGQGTTEYLIILAIVIVIALVVVGVLGGFGSQGSAISASQSKTYWGSTQPIAIIDWGIPSSGTGSLVFKNLSPNMLTITDVNWNNANVDITDTTIAPSQTITITSASFTCGGSTSQSFSRVAGYTYTTSTLTGVKVYGRSPIVGKCQ